MYTLNLSAEQVKLIYETLMDLPAKTSMATLETIRTQVDAANSADVKPSQKSDSATEPGREQA